MGDATSTKEPYNNWPNDAAFNVTTMYPSPVELEVVGTFPPETAGILYRTGPSHYKVDTVKGEYTRSHWFDGFASLHRFKIEPDASGSCRVYYTSRSQVDELIEMARKKGALDGFITFGQKRDPCMSFFEKVKSSFLATAPNRSHPSMFNVGVTVAPNMPGMPKNTLTSLTDANQIQHADIDTLEPVGVTVQSSLHPALKGPLSCAHAQQDPVTGDIYNYNLDFGPWATYRIFRTSAKTSKTEILATITGPGTKPAYIHSFFLSADFIVFCIWPAYLTFNGVGLLWERNFVDAMKFDPKAEVKWYVIDRKGGRGHVATFTSPAFFSFHTVNAFQESPTTPTASGEPTDTVDIYCDIVQTADDSQIKYLYYESLLSTGSGPKLSEGPPARLVRYKLPGVPKTGKVTAKRRPVEVVTSIEHAGELPRINPLYLTKRQRYVYGIVDRGYSSFVDGLAKADLETGTLTVWGKEPKPHTPGEAIFIPDGTGDGEDAGYLLSVVLDGEKGTSYLVCLNAKDMTEVARAEHCDAIPMSVHGTHQKL